MEAIMATMTTTFSAKAWQRALPKPKPKPEPAYQRTEYTEGEERYFKWAERPDRPRDTIGVYELARRLGTTAQKLMRLTEGQTWRFDFGRDRNGRLLTVFVVPPLRKWARRRFAA
jgi:hypothetical protein